MLAPKAFARACQGLPGRRASSVVAAATDIAARLRRPPQHFAIRDCQQPAKLSGRFHNHTQADFARSKYTVATR